MPATCCHSDGSLHDKMTCTKKCYPARDSDTKSAVVRHNPGGQVTINVPPCIHETPMAGALVARLLDNKWEFHLNSDMDPRWSAPLPKAGIRKVERNLGKRSEPVRKCWVCEASCRLKCQGCLETYYCSLKCQKRHWKTHKDHCKEPTPAIEQHVCIAVPDYECFFQYQQALSGVENSSTYVGIMVMSRGNFDAMFGSKNHLRTIVNLALFGKPSLLPATAFCGA